MRKRAVVVVALSLPAVWLACGTFDGDGATPGDGGRDEASLSDATPSDSADDAGPPPTAFDDAENWKTFNLTGIAPGQSWNGAGFDNRYLYLAPESAVVARYDTMADFTAKESWSLFDTTPLANGKGGASVPPVFDGRWMYFAPFFNAPTQATVASRYDTHGDFNDIGSWQALSGDALRDGGVAAAGGLVYDGTKVISIGSEKTYDTKKPKPAFYLAVDPAADFGDASAIQQVAAAGFDGGNAVFTGGALVDGSIYAGSLVDTRVLRLGTNLDRADEFDYSPTHFDNVLYGSYGTVTDNRYVYFVPFLRPGAPSATHGRLCRQDTTKALDDLASYEVFDLSVIDPQVVGYLGGTFDGRFIYLTAAKNGHFVRYDTTKPFGNTSSFEMFDVTPILSAGEGAANRSGAVFDGQYVYFMPFVGANVVIRFKARNDRIPWQTASTF